jgi:hypothetical protein
MANDRRKEPDLKHDSGQEETIKSRTQYDLCSEDVIVRLKAGDLSLINAIASQPYQRISDFIAPEASILGTWKEVDEKLKTTLQTHIEVLGRLFALEDAVVEILATNAGRLSALLRDLSMELSPLFLDISVLFYDFGISMWNFVDDVMPGYYEPFAEMPSFLSEMTTGEEPCGSRRIAETWSDFAERLVAVGLRPDRAQATQAALLEFLHWSRSYRKVLMLLYQAETGIDSLFALNHATAMAIRLMGISYSSRLVVSVIAMDPALRAAG